MIFILRIHAIGVPEGVTLLEFEGASQEEEPEVQATDKAAAEEELPSALTTVHPLSWKASPGAL